MRTAERALAGVLAAGEGRPELARERLDEAVRRGAEGWVYALRGAVREAQGDLAGAKRDLDAALKRRGEPWIRFQRAKLLRRMGLLWSALGDLRRVSRAEPKSPEPLLTAAAIHFDQARHGEALRCLNRALAAAPRAGSLWQQRAAVRRAVGDLAGALADLERARRLAPEDHTIALDRVQALVLCGDGPGAERALAQARWLPPGAEDFWLAYGRCRQGRFGESAALFARAERRLEPGEWRERCRLYRWVARLLERGPAEASPGGRELVVAGLGLRHPFQLSAGAVAALAGSELVFNNVSDPAVNDLLGLLPVPPLPTFFRNTRAQAGSSARVVLDALRTRRRVALVTRGHPIVFGPLAWALAEGCRRRGWRCRVVGAVSTFDVMPVLAPEPPGRAAGLQVRDASELEGLSRRLPLLLYRPLSARGPGLGRALRGYPARQLCHAMAGQGESRGLISVPVRGWKDAIRRAGHSCTLYVPAQNDR